MAGNVNIFERYGIKEVANVSLFALAPDEKTGIKEGDVVLYLDTLKVSTIENTAENVSAQGGWGNPKLVTWDYGKDINVTLEDAVVSWEELRIILGGQIKKAGTATTVVVRKTAEKVIAYEEGGTLVFPTESEENNGGATIDGKHMFPTTIPDSYRWINMTTGERGNKEAFTTDNINEGDRVRFFWEESITEEGQATEIIISPNTFPGTYRVVGDALIRSEATGKDEAFQFVINKAKMLSEVTLTMQADGDPSTFNMTLNVLRDNDGNMMSLIKYN